MSRVNFAGSSWTQLGEVALIFRRAFIKRMSRSFLVDSLIGNNSPPSYPLPYYGSQLPNYMFNFFNLGLSYQPIRPVPRPPAMPVPISPPALGVLSIPGQSPPSPLNTSTSRLSGKLCG